MENNKFIINTKGGISYVDNVITCFNIGDDKYCLYSIQKEDKNHDIYVAKLVNNELITINDAKELERVDKIVKKLIPNNI